MRDSRLRHDYHAVLFREDAFDLSASTHNATSILFVLCLSQLGAQHVVFSLQPLCCSWLGSGMT